MNYTRDEVKKMIIQRFNNRTNDDLYEKIDFHHNQDILDGIASTYLYYIRNFPEKIDTSKIAHSHRFDRMLNKSLPDNMADLYLDRLLLNMFEIGKITDAGVKGQASNKGIYLNKNLIFAQIDAWKSNKIYFRDGAGIALKGKEEIVSKNLYKKIIVHELSHLSAFSWIDGCAGFCAGSRMKEEQTYASRLEEICAEATALNVTQQKIPSFRAIKNGSVEIRIAGYNPESSNYYISSFIELAPFAFGRKEFETGRLTNAETYMKELNEKHSAFARADGTFAGRIQNDFVAITDKNEYNRLPDLQADFIDIGMRRITNHNYLYTCDEKQFKSDIGTLIRIEKLLCTCYKDNKLQPTRNVVFYNKAMKTAKRIFDNLKTKRNMFSKYNSFEDFHAEGMVAMFNAQRRALGLAPIVSESESTVNR